ncbi:MAG: Hsp20 family protein [Chloroflexi bacterium]|nr:Hsp20 family protein [Chloroflexota bacterium]
MAMPKDLDELLSMRDVMDRALVGTLSRSLHQVDRMLLPRPTMDMYETPEAFVLKASLPGVQSEDVELSVTGDTLTIKGEVKEEEEIEEKSYLLRERHYGSFSRSVQLPEGVNVDAADANFSAGVLILTLPKRAELKAKSIPVSAK